METENKDVAATQIVTEDKAVSQSDTGKDVSQNSTDDKGVSQVATDKDVPYSRFKEVNDAKNASDEQLATLKAENESLMAQNAVAKANPAQQDTLHQQIVKRLGLQDEPYLSTEQQGLVQTEMHNVISAQSRTEAFVAAHPDFADVVGATGPNGNFVFAAPMQRALAKLPNIAQSVYSGQLSPQAIYEIAKTEVEPANTNSLDLTKAAAEAKAAIETVNQQASISEAVGSGGTVSKAERIKNMSDAEFTAYKATIMDGDNLKG